MRSRKVKQTTKVQIEELQWPIPQSIPVALGPGQFDSQLPQPSHILYLVDRHAIPGHRHSSLERPDFCDGNMNPDRLRGLASPADNRNSALCTIGDAGFLWQTPSYACLSQEKRIIESPWRRHTCTRSPRKSAKRRRYLPISNATAI